MQIDYLEIVTPDVDAVCATYERLHGVSFGAPEPGLGGARTAELAGGARIGVRGPLHESEQPVVRPYWRADDIAAGWSAALAAGAEEAHPPLELPGHGTFAIYVRGGVHHGLWQRTAAASAGGAG
jgi:predicted enzyme related to lactoylglutathione lyase